MSDKLLSYLKAHGVKIALSTLAAILLTIMFSGAHCDTGDAVPTYGAQWFASVLWPIVTVAGLARAYV